MNSRGREGYGEMVSSYMSLVSNTLSDSKPIVYGEFLRAMVAFDNGTLEADRCLRIVRRLFSKFPRLLSGFEHMYRALVGEDKLVAKPSATHLLKSAAGESNFADTTNGPNLNGTDRKGRREDSPAVEPKKGQPLEVGATVNNNKRSRNGHIERRGVKKIKAAKTCVTLKGKGRFRACANNLKTPNSTQFLRMGSKCVLNVYFAHKIKSGKLKELLKPVFAGMNTLFHNIQQNDLIQSLLSSTGNDAERFCSNHVTEVNELIKHTRVAKDFLYECYSSQVRENLEKERNNAKAYARSRQNFRPFHNSNRSNELIGEMDDHPDTKLEIVARDLSQTLNRPCGYKRQTEGAVVVTSIPCGRGSGDKPSYSHDAIRNPVFPPNPHSSCYIGISDNYYKDDESVLRYVPWFGDNDEEGVDLSAYDVVPGEEDKMMAHEGDDYLAITWTFTIVLAAHMYGGLLGEDGERGRVFDGRNVSKVPKSIFCLVGKLMGGFGGSTVFQRIEELLSKSKNGFFIDTVYLKQLDGWAQDIYSKSRKKRGLDQQRTDLTRSTLSIFCWKKEFRSDIIASTKSTKFAHAKKKLSEDVRSRFQLLPEMQTIFANGSAHRGLRKGPFIFAGDEDNVNGSIEQDAGWLMESYKSLFCRRCFVYDCQKHGAEHPVPRWPEKINVGRRGSLTPCSGSCHLAVKRKTARISNAALSNVSNPDVELAYQVLRSTNGNTCKAVNILGNHWGDGAVMPSCIFLHILVSQKWPELLEDDEQKGRAKKGKKQMKPKPVRRERLFTDASFKPCDHEGACTVANGCSCAKNNNYCEKYCACVKSCKNRYLGCNCRGKCVTKTCHCVAASRECDPDLCVNCVCDDSCHNCVMHKRRVKLVIGHSSIHGWGCFTTEFIKRGAFISSYLGELISQDEADRRGKIYDKLKCSFLFDLNTDYVIDATRKGNKLKYANHSHEFANMAPRIVIRNGDHYVHMYAKRDIEPGEELCFNYGYGSDGSGNEWANLKRWKRR